MVSIVSVDRGVWCVAVDGIGEEGKERRNGERQAWLYNKSISNASAMSPTD